MSSDQQVILISGGSRGLGQALVSHFLARGQIVVTFSRSRTSFIEQCLQADPDGQRFFWQALDGTDSDAVKRFVLAAAARYGRIDALINNAGVATEGVLALMRVGDIQQMIAVNLEGAILLTHICTRVMLSRGRGAIVNISSLNGVRGHAGVAVYSATKAGLDGLTRSLAREVGSRGIRVNSVAPGYFESDMTEHLDDEQRARITRRTPLGRLGTTADIIGAVQFLLSAEASFITGQTLVVDGGLTC